MGANFCQFMRSSEIASPKENGLCPLLKQRDKKDATTEKKTKTEKTMSPSDKQLIQQSWAVFMQKPFENNMIVFISCLLKYPEYKEIFHVQDKCEAEIANDNNIKEHVAVTATFIYDFINNMDQKDMMDDCLSDMSKYNQEHEYPGSTTVDFKDMAIRYMQYQGYIDLHGVKVWHKFLDEPFKALLCTCPLQ